MRNARFSDRGGKIEHRIKGHLKKVSHFGKMYFLNYKVPRISFR
jgi:hypothetical protein